MQFPNNYINALKNLNKKYYLMPFLVLMYSFSIFRLVNAGPISFSLYLIFLIFTYILRVITYPHSKFFIETTLIYKKIFGQKNLWEIIRYNLGVFLNIGKDTPDDEYIKSSQGTTYRIGTHHKSKSHRVYEARSTFGLFFIFKFIFIDFVLKLFVCMGVFIFSPLIFLLAVPMLEKNLQKI